MKDPWWINEPEFAPRDPEAYLKELREGQKQEVIKSPLTFMQQLATIPTEWPRHIATAIRRLEREASTHNDKQRTQASKA